MTDSATERIKGCYLRWPIYLVSAVCVMHCLGVQITLLIFTDWAAKRYAMWTSASTGVHAWAYFFVAASVALCVFIGVYGVELLRNRRWTHALLVPVSLIISLHIAVLEGVSKWWIYWIDNRNSYIFGSVPFFSPYLPAILKSFFWWSLPFLALAFFTHVAITSVQEAEKVIG